MKVSKTMCLDQLSNLMGGATKEQAEKMRDILNKACWEYTRSVPDFMWEAMIKRSEEGGNEKCKKH